MTIPVWNGEIEQTGKFIIDQIQQGIELSFLLEVGLPLFDICPERFSE